MTLEPPEFVRLSPKLGKNIRARARPHHSTTDWDHIAGRWALDTTKYVSAPSSYRSGPNVSDNWAVLKGVHLTEGRIVDSFWMAGCYSDYFEMYGFRIMQATGSVSFTVNHYRGSIHKGAGPNLARIRWWRQGGSGTFSQYRTLDPQLPTSTWNRIRITWWVSEPGLMLSIEMLSGEEWIQIADDGTDPTNQHEDPTKNRVAVGGTSDATPYGCWHDNTEIWGRP